MSKAVTELIFFKFFCNWSGTEQLHSFYYSINPWDCTADLCTANT